MPRALFLDWRRLVNLDEAAALRPRAARPGWTRAPACWHRFRGLARW
jgi:hypothetical protein